MKVFKYNHICKSVLLSLCLLSFFTACKTEAEFDGDILEAIEADTSSIISFKKDRNSPVAFELAYTIGGDYTVQDLPGNEDEKVDQLNPGFDLIGWKLEDTDSDLRSVFTFDDKGCVKSFHMGTRSLTLYGGGYIAASDTPYKIIYKTQNITMDGYDYYDEQAMTGTTSTPDAPSYTDATNNLKNITGFTARTDLLTEREIKADGTTVVEVLYDRNAYTLTFHANDGSGSSEAIDTQTFYYEVSAPLKANSFVRSGYSFAGWSGSRTGSVAYANGTNYTIGVGDADLYAIWTLPNISITISLPGADEVGITYSVDSTDPNKVTISAVIPDGHTASEYTFKWYNSNTVPVTLISGASSSSYDIDTTGWSAGYYQYTLIAELSGTPAGGGTVQIQVE